MKFKIPHIHNIFHIYIYFFLFIFFLCNCNLYSQKVTFDVKPKTVLTGDTATLYWDIPLTLKPKTIQIEKHASYLSAKDSIKVCPNKTTSYKLIFETKGKKIIRSIRLVVKPPQIFHFTVPGQFNEEEAVNISWDVAYADKIKLLPLKDSLPKNGKLTLMLDSSITLTLLLTNKNGITKKETKSCYIVRNNLLTGDTIITKGQSTQIKWRYSRHKYVSIAGIADSLPNKGNIILSPNETTTYQFIFHDSAGNKLQRKLRIRVFPPDVAQVNAPPYIYMGHKAKMEWAFKSDSVIMLNSKKLITSKGSTEISPKTTTTYLFEFKYKKEKIIFPKTVEVKDYKFCKATKSFQNLKKNEKCNVEIFAVDQSQYPEYIKLHVKITDNAGNFITHLGSGKDSILKLQNFFQQLIENHQDTKYPVNDFSVKEITREKDTMDYVFVLDYSGSMGNDAQFLDRTVKNLITNKSDYDRFAFVKFDNRPETVVPLTSNKKKLLENFKFEGIRKFGGSTALYASIGEGLMQFDSLNKNKKNIIVFTDGYENASAAYFGTHPVTALQAADYCKQKDAQLHIVSFKQNVNYEVLEELGWLCDGKHYNITGDKQIDQVFSEINHVTKCYYEITYKPIIGEGYRNIELITNNNVEKNTFKTERKIYIGDSINIDLLNVNSQNSIKQETQNPLIDSISKTMGGKVIAAPQILALFDFDQSKILPPYKDNFRIYAEKLKNNPQLKALLIGHTDQVGDDNYCYKLSVKRADAAKGELVKFGANPKNIKTQGKGKNEPIWHTEDTELKANENRRVEIIIMK